MPQACLLEVDICHICIGNNFKCMHLAVNCHQGSPQAYQPNWGCHHVHVHDASHLILAYSCGCQCGHGGPTKRMDDVSSHGTLMVICGGWYLTKDWAMSLKPGSHILFWETGLPGGIFAFLVKTLGALALLASCFIAKMMRGLVCPRKGVVRKWPQGQDLLFLL